MPSPDTPESRPRPFAQVCLPLLRLACAQTGADSALLLEGPPAQERISACVGQAVDGNIRLSLDAWPATRRNLALSELPAASDWHSLQTAHGLQSLTLLPLLGDQALLCLLHRQPPRNLDDACLADLQASLENLLAQSLELHSLRLSEQRMSLAIDGSDTGIWDRDLRSGRIHYSTRWKALLGYADDEIGDDIQDSYARVHPEDLPGVQHAIADHLQQRSAKYEVEHRIRHRDGHYGWVRSCGKVVERDADGTPLRMIGTTTDISALRGLAERLQQSAEMMSALSNEIPGMVFQYHAQTTGNGHFTYVSAGAQEIYGLSPAELCAAPDKVQALIHPDDLTLYLKSLSKASQALSPWHLEYRIRRSSGEIAWRMGAARPTPQADGSVLWHGFVTDITARKNIEAELNLLATTDSLTQLANRRHFIRQLDAELARLRRSLARQAALLMFDLDHFKRINDTWGHAVGDQALRHFTEILRKHLRKGDIAGRIGGEEFTVLLNDANLDDALHFAQRIQQELLHIPLLQGEQRILLTTSIGVATLSGEDRTAEAALTRSDLALYRAKHAGRNRIEHQ
ncbi:sensor domain-containing diguanylate cyclase [Pseudomonas sp. AA-38]|uniref:sensor domain-containing diguanylate cyclase n=1 Tax=Pseudomonas sp. AA-38 TaxID=3028807 RepID=UPI0023F7E1AF|nr:sensor domain-containing diguanylate cyclase [Pseudomonas sp. AA-38]